MDIRKVHGSKHLMLDVHGPEQERRVYRALPRFTSKARFKHIYRILADGLRQEIDAEASQPETYPFELEVSRRDLGRLATHGVISRLKYQQAVLNPTPRPRTDTPGYRLVSSTVRQIDTGAPIPVNDRPIDYLVDFPGEYNDQ